jgi:hypothetical protein
LAKISAARGLHRRPAAEEALGFIFDAVANASAKARGITAEDLARKNKPPHSGEIQQISSDPGIKKQQFWE